MDDPATGNAPSPKMGLFKDVPEGAVIFEGRFPSIWNKDEITVTEAEAWTNRWLGLLGTYVPPGEIRPGDTYTFNGKTMRVVEG